MSQPPLNSLSAPQVEEAANNLAQRRLRGLRGDVLPTGCRPLSLADALAIQASVMTQMGDAVGGWKCGTPAPDRVVVAPIYASTIGHESSWSVWPYGAGIRVEPELAFVMSDDLPPRDQPYQLEEIISCIGQVHLALELIASRYDDSANQTFPDKLADGLVNQGLWLGPVIAKERALAAIEIPISWSATSVPEKHLAGIHPDRDPIKPLVWLANDLASRSTGLKRGQVVITGSYAGSFDCPLNEALRFRFGELGAFEVTFASKSSK